MAAVALFMVGRLAKFNDIFTSTVPTINNFSNHALRINCLTLFVQLKIQNNILFLYTTKFNWNVIKSIAELGETRMNAMNSFLDSYELGKISKKYIPTSVLDLPFDDNEFDISFR